MRYTPKFLPVNRTLPSIFIGNFRALCEFTWSRKVGRSRPSRGAVETSRRYAGYADGTDWTGVGAGFYERKGGAWVKL